ncbi:hypothetical protein KCV04_g16277, partial [Aureobasidium melanogenum]
MALPQSHVEKTVEKVEADQIEDVEYVKDGQGLMHLDDGAQRALTRRVLWKLDTRILPVLALLFLCS